METNMEKRPTPSRQTWLVISGNLKDGFEFYGPFRFVAVATQWAETNLKSDWWIAKLERP
jgi:hypothetical protein